ncbi:MAG: hypothetical protein ACE5IC_04415 [Candidatus Brocadiales bacterium]
MIGTFTGRPGIYLYCLFVAAFGCMGEEAPAFEGKEGTYLSRTASPLDQRRPLKEDQRQIPGQKKEKLMVGALYYIWWGLLPGERDMWERGHGLSPSLGEYPSRDPDIAEQHIKWATEHGINLFEVSWSGPGQRAPELDNDEIDAALREGLLAAPSIEDMKFLLVYETERALIQEAQQIGYNNIRKAFIEDILYASERYFDHPSYFKLNGRPVVMVWKAKDVLETLLKENGMELQDVLHEVEKGAQRDIFWVSLGEDVYEPERPPTEDPILNVLDAVAPLLGDTFALGEVKTWRKHLDKVETGYGLWSAAGKKLGFVFIPSVIPGFDDRAFNQGQNRFLKMDPDGFYQAIRLAKKLARDRGNWISIYGFNEWFECGAIEPTKEFGLRFLETLKEAVRD